ncbi:MAG: hypothetical protein R3F31_23340 [Verrucomicrobiales bacterium]
MKPEVALNQMEVEKAGPSRPNQWRHKEWTTHPAYSINANCYFRAKQKTYRCLNQYASMDCRADPQRVGRDAGKIAEEVIAHIASIIGAEVTVRLDIGSHCYRCSDNVVRSPRTPCILKFSSQGFEVE